MCWNEMNLAGARSRGQSMLGQEETLYSIKMNSLTCEVMSDNFNQFVEDFLSGK